MTNSSVEMVSNTSFGMRSNSDQMWDFGPLSLCRSTLTDTRQIPHKMENGYLYESRHFEIKTIDFVWKRRGSTKWTLKFGGVNNNGLERWFEKTTGNQHLGIWITSLKAWIVLDDLEISENPGKSEMVLKYLISLENSRYVLMNLRTLIHLGRSFLEP